MTVQELYKIYKQFPKVSTDTRKIEQGTLFFALKGERFNGNQFAEKALESGAAYAVIDEEAYSVSDRCILVDNVLSTLQALARYHREQMDIPFIAVTGSNGKTTTKEILYRVLGAKYKTHATKGNLNNHIGVPLTLLDMPTDTEMALIEMGDNHVGEVAELCEIAKPNYGFITNIGKDHIEGFGSFEANVRAKSEIFDYLLKTEGTAFASSQDRIISNMARRFESPVWYGGEYDFSDLTFLDASPFVSYQDRHENKVQTQLIGKYNFENIQIVACIGKYFEVEAQAIHKAIAEYVPSNNRSQLLDTDKNKIILDAYNANPSSVEAALVSLDAFKSETNKKAVILGDMLELGEISEQEHQSIIDKVVEIGVEKRFFVGQHFFKQNSEKGHFFAVKEDLITYLQQNPLEGYIVLMKGSRGIGLETAVEFL